VPMMDGSRAAQITFDNVTLSADAVLGAPGCGWALLEPVLQEARIASCAEALGIIEILGEKTVEYARTRSQFGTPIGSFQALQHRMVDMFIAAQQSRSMLYRAICEYQQDEDSAPATLAAMKSFIGRRGREVGAEAIQLHGGMGMTDELDIGHYAKRLMMLHQLFGDSDAARAEFCARSYAA
jgi:alkylation response protein AidB-like acyl-CoA dehydrogenase